MCGRYGLTASIKELKERYDIENDEYSFEESEEIFPTTDNTVLLPNHKLYKVKWGFTPSFAKRPLINARSESVLEEDLQRTLC
ncbi:MAG: SOS response-associated peptidase family protein [Alkalibacterium sp.]|nr:SOS response-associated peptidase family protein [Alkalibacterium sp.]